MQDNQREELSYLAGLFDGEGTICIQKDNRPCFEGNGKGWNPIYNAALRIGMIDKDSIEQYIKFFKVGQTALETHRERFRPMYRWQVRAKDQVIHVLKLITPFLRLKKPQAILAMRFYEETPSRRGLFLTEEILNKKQEFFLQMKQLNGVDITPLISPATTKRVGKLKSIRV